MPLIKHYPSTTQRRRQRGEDILCFTCRVVWPCPEVESRTPKPRRRRRKVVKK